MENTSFVGVIEDFSSLSFLKLSTKVYIIIDFLKSSYNHFLPREMDTFLKIGP